MRWISALALLGLAACGSSPRQGAAPDNAAPDNVATATSATTAPEAVNGAAPPPANQSAVAAAEPAGPVSCAAEIGAAAAAKRVKVCRNVSPATRPPCNAQNSCAMIEDEIARSCALFDGKDAKGGPMPGCGPDPKGMEAAADVVRLYYSALNARDYGTAWQQWGDDGPPGQPLPKFEAGFAKTRATHVTIGKMEPGDGAAGSSYQTVPVTVEAELTDGTRQRFAGDYVIRRVNDVDGASAAQKRWHIDQAHLKKAG